MCCLLTFLWKILTFSPSWREKWLLQLHEWWYWSWDSWCLLGWKICCTFFLAMMIRAEFPQVSAKWAAAENSKKMRKKLCGHWSARNCDVLLFKKYLLQLYSNQPYIRTFSCCKHISNSCYSSSSSLTVQPDFRWCCCCITMEVTMTAKSLMVQPCNINCGDNDFILKSIWIELLLARKQQHHIYFKQTCIVKFIMLINHLLGKLPTRTLDT